MTEIEAKARQLARIEGAPLGSYSICKQAIALEMAEWIKEKVIEKIKDWSEKNSIDDNKMQSLYNNLQEFFGDSKTKELHEISPELIKRIEDGMYNEDGWKDIGDGMKMDRDGHIIGGLKLK